MKISQDDNDEIMGIPIQLGIMCCIKKNTIRKLHITTPVSGASPTTWYADDPVSFNGTPAEWSITQTPYGIVYLGWDHWYLFDGVKSVPIIDEFNHDDILHSRISKVTGFYHKGIFLAAYSINDVGNPNNDRVMRWNFLRKALSTDLINVDSFAARTGDDEGGELYYGASNIGHAYMAEDSDLWLTYFNKTQLDNFKDKSNVLVEGTENDPYFSIQRDETIDELTGTIDNLTGTIDMDPTNGYIAFPAVEVRAGSLGSLYWNEKFYHASDDVEAYTRSGSTQAAVEDGTSCTATNATNLFTAAGHGLSNGNRVQIDGTAVPTGISDAIMYFVVGVAGNDFQVALTSGGSAVTFSDDGTAVTFKKWDGPLSDPNGTEITSSAANWVQVGFWLSANSTAGSPRVYYSDQFVIKYDYRRGTGASSVAESSVPFIYQTGYRNFQAPIIDKIFKKIQSEHYGELGTFTIFWYTENSNGSFTIDLTTYNKRWDSFFPSTAFGKSLDIRVYKNDLNDFKMTELKGLWTPEPPIA
jgi:hypothetical protein